MPTFTWIADNSPARDMEPRVNKSPFGDGFEQRMPDGINNKKEVFDVAFSNRDFSEIDEIDNFLMDLNGSDYFEWTGPRAATPKKYLCRKWRRVFVNAAVDTLTAVFEEVADA